jgi:N-acetylglucosaminyl-diphospho-decaprenol L-rhamnosyltransferase
MLRTAERFPDSLVEARQFPEEHPKHYDPVTGLTLWASGACLLIPRRIYETIDGFDPNIFMYMEDVDYSWRAKAAGYSVRVAPRALFAHSVLDRQPNLLIEKYYYFSARYLAHKWAATTQQKSFESVILERRYVEELPPLPELTHPASRRPVDLSPAVFDWGFAYAPLRWS